MVMAVPNIGLMFRQANIVLTIFHSNTYFHINVGAVNI